MLELGQLFSDLLDAYEKVLEGDFTKVKTIRERCNATYLPEYYASDEDDHKADGESADVLVKKVLAYLPLQADKLEYQQQLLGLLINLIESDTDPKKLSQKSQEQLFACLQQYDQQLRKQLLKEHESAGELIEAARGLAKMVGHDKDKDWGFWFNRLKKPWRERDRKLYKPDSEYEHDRVRPVNYSNIA